MKNYLSLLAIVLFFGNITLLAQDYEPPKNVKYEKQEDYAKYETDVIKCIEYLEKAPLDNSNNRIAANTFFITWISGSPNVSIEIHPYISNLTKENKDFLITFMGGWTKYALENHDYKDKIKGHLAGLHAIIRVYKENKSVKSDDAVDELVSIDKDGKLEDWLQIKLKEK